MKNTLINYDGSTKPLNELQRAAINEGRKCFACGKDHWTGIEFMTGYPWRAEPSHTSFYPKAWTVWQVTECGALANTEPVATFVGKYHNAEANAKEACEAHNWRLAQMADAVRNFIESPPQVAESAVQQIESADDGGPIEGLSVR